MFGLSAFSGGIPLSRIFHSGIPGAVQQVPHPHQLIVPLLQHSGENAQPVVKRGDHVTCGQLIGEPSGTISAAIHAPASGTVTAVTLRQRTFGAPIHSIHIQTDSNATECLSTPFEKPWREAAPQELLRKIEACGIVDMGISGTPIHLTLNPSSHTPIDSLIINAVECDPYVFCDHSLVLDRLDDLLQGALIVKKIVNAKKIQIAVAAHTPDLAKAFSTLVPGEKYPDITIVVVQSKYPHHNQRLLAGSLTKRAVPSGKTPADIGCIVISSATTVAVFDAIINGTPLIRRIVTVAGSAVSAPGQYSVLIGTPIRTLLELCATDFSAVKKVCLGGVLCGVSASSFDEPVIKTTQAILALTEVTPSVHDQYPCIGCGQCLTVCPMRLVPSFLSRAVLHNDLPGMVEWGLGDCIECGCCSYVCPSKINLVHAIKLGKYLVSGAATAERPAPMFDDVDEEE